MYRQCILRNGNVTTTSYIPAAYAVIGKVLKLKTISGWEDGWKVEHVGGVEPIEQEQAFRKLRSKL